MSVVLLPLTLRLPTEADTAAFARRLAVHLRPGDCLLLSGPIGAGKSFFARALIRAALANPAEDVPSPSFTLVQTYQAPGYEIWHCDLYRLTTVQDVAELGLDDAFATAVCLIEWPDRLGNAAPPGALHLTFGAGEGFHQVTCAGPDQWRDRLGHAGV